jgi:hypothetical protein
LAISTFFRLRLGLRHHLLVSLGLVDLEVVVQDLHGEQLSHGPDQDELPQAGRVGDGRVLDEQPYLIPNVDGLLVLHQHFFGRLP